MNYVIVSIISVVAIILGTVIMLYNSTIPKIEKFDFALVAVFIIIEFIIDSIIFSDIVNNVTLIKILKAIEFSLTPIIATIFAKIIAHIRFWNRIKWIFYIIFLINLILCTASIFVPIMFDISNNFEYIRTDLSVFYFMCLIIDIVLIVYISNHTIIQNNKKYDIYLISIIILLIIGVTIRELIIDSNSDWLCLAFCYYIFSMYIINGYNSVDSLTSLLNRKSYDNRINLVCYDTAIIMFDANNFKEINDTYGHQSGDLALSIIGKTIYDTFYKYGFCHRYGGDEFIVVIKRGMLNKLTMNNSYKSSKAAINELVNRFHKSLEKESKTYPILKYGVSVGYGIYYPKNDDGSNNLVEDAIKEADKMMYENKNKNKKEK